MNVLASILIIACYFIFMIYLGNKLPTSNLKKASHKRGVAISIVIVTALFYTALHAFVTITPTTKLLVELFGNIMILWTGIVAGLYIAGGY